MKKRYGIISNLIWVVIGTTFYCPIFFSSLSEKAAIIIWLFMLSFYAIFGFSILVINNDKVKVYGVIPFFSRNMKVKISEIKKVQIYRSSGFRNNKLGGYRFCDYNDNSTLEFSCTYFAFEIRESIKEFEKLNIAVEWQQSYWDSIKADKSTRVNDNYHQ